MGRELVINTCSTVQILQSKPPKFVSSAKLSSGSQQNIAIKNGQGSSSVPNNVSNYLTPNAMTKITPLEYFACLSSLNKNKPTCTDTLLSRMEETYQVYVTPRRLRTILENLIEKKIITRVFDCYEWQRKFEAAELWEVLNFPRFTVSHEEPSFWSKFNPFK